MSPAVERNNNKKKDIFSSGCFTAYRLQITRLVEINLYFEQYFTFLFDYDKTSDPKDVFFFIIFLIIYFVLKIHFSQFED